MRKHISIILTVVLMLSVFFTFGGVALAAADFTVETDVSEMTEGGSVEFRATITNNTGSPLVGYTIKYGNHVCYDAGGATLAVGESKEVTFLLDVSEGMLGNPIQFDLHSGVDIIADDSVTINKKVLSIIMGASATVNRTLVGTGETVKFEFAIENQGEATLDDIVVTAPQLNNGDPLNTAFSLSAGQSYTVKYSHVVSAAVIVQPTVSYSSGGAAQPAKVLDPIELTLESRSVVPLLTVDNSSPNAGEDVTFTLKITNNGNVPYTNMTVTMNGDPMDFPTSKLNPGKSYSEDYTRSFQTSTDVKFTITLKDHNDEMKSVGSNTIRIQLPVDPNSINAKLILVMNVDRPKLTSAGTINFSGYVSNATEYTLTDVKVDESTIGNIFGVSSMAPGAKENISWSADIDETTTYSFVLTAKDKDGKVYTVNVEDITVTVSSVEAPAADFEDAAEVSPDPIGSTIGGTTDAEVGSLDVLLIVIVVLIVLILGVGVTLLVLWKKGKVSGRVTSSKMTAAKRKTSKSPAKRKSSGSRNYRDRNNF